MADDKLTLLREKLRIADELALLARQYYLAERYHLDVNSTGFLALAKKISAAADHARHRHQEILGIEGETVCLRWKGTKKTSAVPIADFERRTDNLIVSRTQSILRYQNSSAEHSQERRPRLSRAEQGVQSLIESSIIPRTLDWLWDPRFDDLAEKVFSKKVFIEGTPSDNEIAGTSDTSAAGKANRGNLLPFRPFRR